MAQRYQGGILGVGFNPLRAPNAPTIGTATATSSTAASVAFTAPANVGGSAITSYAVQSTPGGIGASGASSPITVSGLTTGTAYTFRVTALNSYGPSPASAASNSVTPVAAGQQAYTTYGTYSWVAPACVTSVSVVTVGGGGGYVNWNLGCCVCEGRAGGGGGALAYANNISVTPGTSYTVVVGSPGFTGAGGTSSFINTSTVAAGGGTVAGVTAYQGGKGGVVVAGTGFAGGAGGNVGGAAVVRSGAGGAGGYTGVGGRGGNWASNGVAGAGGGGGGGSMSGCPYTGGAGGGVGILGQGSNGAGGVSFSTLCAANGGAGSGGSGQLYGGGTSSGSPAAFAGVGAVRIIWPGTSRSFPSTNTGNL
jgi:hypothetical protein